MSASAGPFLTDLPVASDATRRDSDDEALATDLLDRLAWFVRLRWIASAGLVLIATVGGSAAGGRQWDALAVLAGIIAAYNVGAWWRLERLARATPIGLRANALEQMVFDLAALLAAIFVTGRLGSPLLPFFGFHMAIGTILLGSHRMFFVAAGTSLCALLLHLPDVSGAPGAELDSAVSLLAFIGFLFGTVYLTGSVSDPLKQRNSALRRTTTALEERTSELQQLVGELEELEARKSHYMRVSAHQLRSPLGTLRTSLDVLAEGYVDPASERGQRLIRGAAERVDGLLLLVNGLLDLAKVREGRQRAPWSRHVNINQLVADLFDSLQPFAEERGVALVADVRGVAILDWGVPPDLVHAIENLIHNAVKYSREGGEVIVHLAASEDVAILRVEDHGIGIPDDFRRHLFLEFMRAPNARRHAQEGSGLGLALVREVASGHGGRVVLERNDGASTVFRLELPRHGAPPAGAAAVTAT